MEKSCGHNQRQPPFAPVAMNTVTFTVCILLCLCSLSMAQNITQYFLNGASGMDTNDCISSAKACQSLAGVVARIDPATAGQIFYTVTVSKGTYSGANNIQVDLKDIEFRLVAEATAGATDVKFDCSTDRTATAFQVTSSLDLTNINIMNCGKAIDFEPVQRASRTNYLSLIDVQVSQCSAGVYAVGGDVIIQASSFRTIGNKTVPGHAISAENVQGFSLVDSLFSESAQWSVVLSTSHDLIDEYGIQFQGCVFLNGGGISLSTDAHFQLRDLVFSGMGSEWAIYMLDGSYSMSNVTINGAVGETVGIYYHTASTEARSESLILDGIRISDVNGTAILVDTEAFGEVQITGSEFTAITGVGVQVGSADMLTVSGCTFNEVTEATVRVTTVTDINVRLAGMTVDHSGPVEATLTEYSNGTLMDSTFTWVSPNALNAHGGRWEIHTTNITHSVPDADNDSRGLTLTNGQYYVSDCEFKNLTNPLGMGGAIYTELSTLSVDTCNFLSNHAESGGAISAFTYDLFHVTGSFFYQNSADMGGGAIELDTHSGTATITNCVFEGNTAEVGAAVDCCSKTEQCTITLSENSSLPNTYTGNVNGNQDASAVNCGADSDDDEGSKAWAWIFGIICALIFLAIVGAGAAFGYVQYQKHKKSNYESF